MTAAGADCGGGAEALLGFSCSAFWTLTTFSFSVMLSDPDRLVELCGSSEDALHCKLFFKEHVANKSAHECVVYGKNAANRIPSSCRGQKKNGRQIS